ncbi:hypothetical protein PSCLAVI8L_270045 [Pseudoclavibacter sp. 8L]|nr:hypothetical protein PSCLAVI8L_270045 [Pseudoclavibacter sp. 8L]
MRVTRPSRSSPRSVWVSIFCETPSTAAWISENRFGPSCSVPTTSTVQRSPIRSSSRRDGQSRTYGSHSGSDMAHPSSEYPQVTQSPAETQELHKGHFAVTDSPQSAFFPSPQSVSYGDLRRLKRPPRRKDHHGQDHHPRRNRIRRQPPRPGGSRRWPRGHLVQPLASRRADPRRQLRQRQRARGRHAGARDRRRRGHRLRTGTPRRARGKHPRTPREGRRARGFQGSALRCHRRRRLAVRRRGWPETLRHGRLPGCGEARGLRDGGRARRPARIRPRTRLVLREPCRRVRRLGAGRGDRRVPHRRRRAPHRRERRLEHLRRRLRSGDRRRDRHPHPPPRPLRRRVLTDGSPSLTLLALFLIQSQTWGLRMLVARQACATPRSPGDATARRPD